MIKSKKHSAFVTLNGINKIMGIYEQWIMDLEDEDIQIVYQNDGKFSRIVFVYSKP